MSFTNGKFLTVQNIRRQLANDNVTELDMMRMVALYALRYEKHSSNDVGGLLNMLSRRGVSEHYKKVQSSITVLLFKWDVLYH